MIWSWSDWKSWFQQGFRCYQQQRAQLLSAAIAYFGLLSLAPSLVIAVYVAGAIFGQEATRREILNTLAARLGADAVNVIERLADKVTLGTEGLGATIVGLGVALFAGSRVFARLQDALNELWGVEPERPGAFKGAVKDIVKKRLLSFGAVFSVGLLVLASMIAKTIFAGLDRFSAEHLIQASYLWRILEISASLAIVGAACGALFRYLPDAEVHWRDVWGGALFAAVFLELATVGIGVYLGFAATSSVSGAAGSVIVLMLWMYISASVFFFGATLTRARAQLREDAGESASD